MNAAAQTSTTLYDDWRQRRAFLEQAERSPRIELHRRVLDYLLHRYLDAPAAQQPARVAFQPGARWNSRRIVVHHHLRRNVADDVKSPAEAQQRVASILHRMVGRTEPAESPTSDPEASVVYLPKAARIWWKHLASRAREGDDIDKFIRRSLSWLEACTIRRVIDGGVLDEAHRPRPLGRSEFVIVEVELRKVDRRAARAMRRTFSPVRDYPLSYFMNCLVDVWRSRVVRSSHSDDLQSRVHSYMSRPQCRQLAAESIRNELAHESSVVRIAAAKLLGRLGTLDDVGLLSDLLSLNLTDEGPDEREVQTHAMKRIADREMPAD